MVGDNSHMEQTQHLIDRADGSNLAIWTIGPDSGIPVVFCHPAPGSGRFDPDPLASAESGVRIIAPNRRGYGRSTRAACKATIAQAGRDVLAALDYFEIPEATIAGWSAGGRVGMWVAAHHPDRVRSLAIVGTPAPQEAVRWIPEEQVAMIEGMKADPIAAIDQMVAVFEPMLADKSVRTSFLSASPVDSVALETDPDLAVRVDNMLDDAFQQGAIGMAVDIASYTMVDWGFDPSDIGVPTLAFSGAEDEVVPPAHGEWYADKIRGASHVVEPRVGHLVMAPVWWKILEHLDR